MIDDIIERERVLRDYYANACEETAGPAIHLLRTQLAETAEASRLHYERIIGLTRTSDELEERVAELEGQLTEARAENANWEQAKTEWQRNHEYLVRRLYAAEARATTTVAERDELTAQLAAARDIAGSIELYAEAGSKIWELSRAILSDLPARAKALMKYKDAAEAFCVWYLSKTKGFVFSRGDEINALLRARRAFDDPAYAASTPNNQREQEQEE